MPIRLLIIAIDSNAVTPSETFSVFSPVVECGVKNPTIVTTVINADGITKLKKGFLEILFYSFDSKIFKNLIPNFSLFLNFQEKRKLPKNVIRWGPF